MLPIIVFLLISAANTQYYYPQQQHLLNNYKSWSSYSQNYPTWNRAIQQKRVSVRGNLLNDDISTVLYGSRITVSLTDTSLQDVLARPLNTIVLYGSFRFPISYEIPYSLAQVQTNSNNIQQYTIQARIEKDSQLLYINDQYTPVRLVPIPVNPVNVVMKKVGTSVYSGKNGGIYTTRPSIIIVMYICQLRPEPGNCFASIEQYYFNTQLRGCQIFIWGGCGGNQNRFSFRDECERTCSPYRRRMLNDNGKQIPIA